MGIARARVVVRGHVQGVFFRAEARARARSLGLAGSVKNLPDGTVEAVFEGPKEHIDSMLRWCEQGPTHHVALGVGHVARDVRAVARMLDLEYAAVG